MQILVSLPEHFLHIYYKILGHTSLLVPLSPPSQPELLEHFTEALPISVSESKNSFFLNHSPLLYYNILEKGQEQEKRNHRGVLVLQFKHLEMLKGKEHSKTGRNISKDKLKALTNKQCLVSYSILRLIVSMKTLEL